MLRRAATALLILLMIAPFAWAQDVPVATTSPSSQELNLRRTVTVDVVARTKDAVVYISTTKLARTSPFGDDPFFRQFFQQNVQVQSLGSGFIIHPDGYVVTNNHVIDRAREITVELSAGGKLAAELLASLDGPADPDAEVAWEAEIACRVAAIEAGTVKLEPWEDVKRRIEKEILGR